MRLPDLQRILAATDLGPGSDAVVRTAATLAAASAAELHLVHAVDLPETILAPELAGGLQETLYDAARELEEQALRVVPGGCAAITSEARLGAPYRVILERASELGAELVVLGPHRGGTISTRFLGTTAERVLRSAGALCLVAREPLRLPLRGVVAPVDFSDPARGAMAVAQAWARDFGSGAEGPAGVQALYVATPPADAVGVPPRAAEVERALQRQLADAAALLAPAANPPPATTARIAWGSDRAATAAEWAGTRGADLLVVGTHGRGGVKRAVLGSFAASLSRQAPCPVLLVPPRIGFRRRESDSLPALGRVVIGTDFGEGSGTAIRYALRNFAGASDTVLVHCVDLPAPPSFLRGRYPADPGRERELLIGARERMCVLRESVGGPELRAEVRLASPAAGLALAAREMSADLIVVGEHGRRPGTWGGPGGTVDRLLQLTPVPVLVAREPVTATPREVLVALDDAPARLDVLRWARIAAERSRARLTVFHALDVAAPDYLPSSAGGFLTGEVEQELLLEGSAWVRQQLQEVGIDTARVRVRVAMGEPTLAILSAIRRYGGDLVVMGAGGGGSVRRALLGSVAASVVREAPCPVLVVRGTAARRRRRASRRAVQPPGQRALVNY